MLAVYASRRGLPQRRARLATSWLAKPYLGRTCTCWVPISNFKAALNPPLPTSQTWPGAPESYGFAVQENLKCAHRSNQRQSWFFGLFIPGMDTGM